MSNSSFKYSRSDFPPMPMPQSAPTNPINNTMLSKLDDLIRKISEVRYTCLSKEGRENYTLTSSSSSLHLANALLDFENKIFMSGF
ncbi:unnamed protein product [Rotaria socialis]|uniref:Uncharacterized protein n=1 Tax=Rotaria socialis TaxID=392032 RepID=A0A820VQD4_9BILA|nr:unnamed protein product [Rotaria socialis]CAF4503417.1 unnamed protein product [Rotaria socialis]CAF4919538.1 unnamed protein product [Rotaria socialis]